MRQSGMIDGPAPLQSNIETTESHVSRTLTHAKMTSH
jgi:hypothetical protein